MSEETAAGGRLFLFFGTKTAISAKFFGIRLKLVFMRLATLWNTFLYAVDYAVEYA